MVQILNANRECRECNHYDNGYCLLLMVDVMQDDVCRYWAEYFGDR